MSTDETEHELDAETTDLLNGEKPAWTDPTSCPYPDCEQRGGELHIEYHLFDEHGWFLIERDFESKKLVDERDHDSGEQATLGEVGQ